MTFASVTSLLFFEPFETIRQLRAAFPLVRQLGDEQRERLGISGNPQGPGVRRIETHVLDQFSAHGFAFVIVAAVQQAWGGAAPA